MNESSISNLAERDRGRAVVLASGAPATVVLPLTWYTGLHNEAVEASISEQSAKRRRRAGASVRSRRSQSLEHEVGVGHTRGNRTIRGTDMDRRPEQSALNWQ
jgi:hypothetical protein